MAITSVAQGSALGLGGAAANGLLQFLLVVVISRGLGPHGAGALYQAIALFTILSAAAQFGADSGLVRMIPWYGARNRMQDVRKMLRVGLWPVLGLSALLGVITFALAPLFAEIFMRGVPTSDAIVLIRFLAPFIPLSATTLVMLSATRGFGTMLPTVAMESVAKPALRVVLVLIAVLVGAGTRGVTLMWALPVALGTVVTVQILASMVRRVTSVDSSATEGRRTHGELAGEFWRFSIPRGMAGVLEVGLGWFDILLLGAFRPAAEVGVYAAVSRTAVMALFALRAVGLAFSPKVSALLARGQRSEAQHLYQVATWWLMALAWPMYLTLAVFAPYLLQVFGSEFVSGQTALMVLSLAMLINVATGNVNAVLLMSGKSMLNLVNAAVALVLNIALNLLLIPEMGINGAAIAWGASILVQNLAALIQVQILLGLSPFGAGYWIVAVASIASFAGVGLVFRLALEPSTPVFMVFAVLTVGVYLTLLFRLRDTIQLPLLREALSAWQPFAWGRRSAPTDG